MKTIGIYMETEEFHWKIMEIHAESYKTSINHANQPEITQTLANSLKSKQIMKIYAKARKCTKYYANPCEMVEIHPEP